MSYYWKATFLSGEIIYQNYDGVEILFQEVLDRMDMLDKFQLIKDDNTTFFEVDIGQGFIDCNRNLLEVVSTKDAKLVYKRTNIINFNEQSKNIIYVVGLDYNEDESTVIEIYEDNKIILMEKNGFGTTRIDITDKVFKG